MGVMYQQAGSYMPSGDSAFRDWLANFSSLIAADPVRYGLTAGDAAVISNHATSYEAVYLPSKQPTTRTPALVQQKDAVKASAMASCRVYAMLIKNNAGVTDDDKVALGLHVNDTTPTPIPAPTTAPLLAIQAAFSGEHIIRYADESTPTSRAKPAGATLIEIYQNVSPGPDPVIASATSVGLFGKQPIHVSQDQANTGLTATYFGRWVTARGLVGPWSLPVAMTIAFGGPVDQAMPTGGTPGTLTGGEDDLKMAA